MRFVVLFLTIFLSCCVPQTPPKPVPHFSLEIHGDVDFTIYERHLIHRATEDLHQQVGMDVSVVYDLDFRDIAMLHSLRTAPVLIRVESDNPIVQQIDEQMHGTTFGFTNAIIGPRITLVVDRLDTEQLYRHVCMHEILHGVGVDHVNDRESVMYAYTNGTHLSTVINEADREALRHAHRP